MSALAPIQSFVGAYVPHPLAELFPLMDGEAMAALVEDIREHGIREPVVMLDGKVLDGRNRYLAARECGQHVPTIEFGGGDALAFVVSINLERRHLTTSQRAMVGARIANLAVGSNQHVVKLRDGAEPGEISPPSKIDTAERLSVDRKTLGHASRVIEYGTPALVAAVDAGQVSVSAAAEVSSLPEMVQLEIVEDGPAAVREAAKEIRETGVVNRTSFTGNNEWFTPADYIERARKALGAFDLDPASNPQAQETVQAAIFYTEEDNGLTKEWNGRVWLNPPYAQPAIGHFIDKLVGEVAAGRTSEAILLTHNYTDTAWFQKAANAATVLCFTRGRVRFVSPTGELAAPTQGQAFFYFGANAAQFEEAFHGVGFLA